MKTQAQPLIPADENADADAVIASAMSGQPLDPGIARRVRERSDKITEEIRRKHGVLNIGVQLIREARGSLDEEEERELTLAQRDFVKQGELRLTDPDTGMVYVLVPEAEYERLRAAR